MLATAVSGEDDLGPEVITKIQSLTLSPRSPLALPAHRCSQVAKGLCRRVLAPARANQSHPTPY